MAPRCGAGHCGCGGRAPPPERLRARGGRRHLSSARRPSPRPAWPPGRTARRAQTSRPPSPRQPSIASPWRAFVSCKAASAAAARDARARSPPSAPARSVSSSGRTPTLGRCPALRGWLSGLRQSPLPWAALRAAPAPAPGARLGGAGGGAGFPGRRCRLCPRSPRATAAAAAATAAATSLQRREGARLRPSRPRPLRPRPARRGPNPCRLLRPRAVFAPLGALGIALVSPSRAASRQWARELSLPPGPLTHPIKIALGSRNSLPPQPRPETAPRGHSRSGGGTTCFGERVRGSRSAGAAAARNPK